MTSLSVAIRGSTILLIRVGQKSGFTHGGEAADEMTPEAAEMLARDLMTAVNEIRRRQADG